MYIGWEEKGSELIVGWVRLEGRGGESSICYSTWGASFGHTAPQPPPHNDTKSCSERTNPQRCNPTHVSPSSLPLRNTMKSICLSSPPPLLLPSLASLRPLVPTKRWQCLPALPSSHSTLSIHVRGGPKMCIENIFLNNHIVYCILCRSQRVLMTYTWDNIGKGSTTIRQK